MNASSFFVTDKFQAALYRFVGSVLAFSVVEHLNAADLASWQTGAMWPIVGASAFLAAVDYVQNMRNPVGTSPTHDGNA